MTTEEIKKKKKRSLALEYYHQVRKYNKVYREYRRSYYKEWYRKYGRIKTIDQVEANIEWRKKHPEGVSAMSYVYRAIKSGKLIKSTLCSICKQKKKIIHGHHSDYSKPLEVIWVCHSCHKNIHWDIIE